MEIEGINKIIAILAFIGAFIFTIKTIYHMWFVVTNVTGKYASFLGAFLLFMPSQFNEIGNKHRIALGPALLGVMFCWAALFFTGVLDK